MCTALHWLQGRSLQSEASLAPPGNSTVASYTLTPSGRTRSRISPANLFTCCNMGYSQHNARSSFLGGEHQVCGFRTYSRAVVSHCSQPCCQAALMQKAGSAPLLSAGPSLANACQTLKRLALRQASQSAGKSRQKLLNGLSQWIDMRLPKHAVKT